MLKTWLVACSLFPLFNGWVHLENVTIHHGNVSYFDESKIAAADPLVMLFLTHTVYFRVDFNDKKVRAQLEDIFREFARRHRKSNVRKPFVQAIGNTQNGGYLVFDPTERAPKTYKSWENITYSDYVPTTIKHYCVSHLELVQTSRITMDCVYSEEQIHIYYPNNKTGKSTISQELLTQEDYNFYTDNHLHTTCYQTMKTKPGKVHMRTICKCHGYYECLEVHRTRKCFVGEIRTKSFDLDKGEGVMDINETIYGHPDIRMPRSAANGCGLYFILSVDDRNAFLRGLFYANHERRRDIMNMSLHDPVFANAFRKQYRIEFPPHHIEKTLFALNYFLDNYTITKEVRIQKDRYYQNYCLFHLMNEGDEQKCVVAIEVGPERFWDNFAIPNVSITELLNSTDYKLKTSGQIGQYFIQWKTYKNTGKSFFVFECKGRRCHDILIKNHAKSSHYITNRTCSSGSRSYTLAELQSPITDFPRVISRFNLCFRAAYKTHEAVSRTYFPLDTDGNYFLVHKAKRFKHPIYRKGIFHSIINMLYQLHTTIKITGRHRDNTRYDTVIETFNATAYDPNKTNEENGQIDKNLPQKPLALTVVSNHVLQSDREPLLFCMGLNTTDLKYNAYDPAIDYTQDPTGLCVSTQKLGTRRLHDYFAKGPPDRFEDETISEEYKGSWIYEFQKGRIKSNVLYGIYDGICDYTSWTLMEREVGCKCFYVYAAQDVACCCTWMAKKGYESDLDRFIRSHEDSIFTYDVWAQEDIERIRAYDPTNEIFREAGF